ncbi:hypothetical protein EUTSA_v10000579mg, partial [Eutrema salsugineum]
LPRKKKVKMNSSETEADSPSSDHSCFVALVTASNLQDDALYLPKEFTSSNGLTRRCRKIVLTDGGERSWTLDLRFNKSSDTFYITRGWRIFCDENGKKAGSFFMFKLMKNGETPLLSFCPAESRGEKASNKESLTIQPSSGKQISKEERKKNHLRCRDSTSPIENRYVTLTATHDSLKKGRLFDHLHSYWLYSPFESFLNLPLQFIRDNGLDKPGMVTLLGKDGTRWLANLRRETTGTMNLGKGWKDFAKANNNKERVVQKLARKSLFLQNLSVETRPGQEHYSGEKCKGAVAKQHLPSQFMRDNGIDKLGKITLLGKEGMTCSAYLLSKDGFVALGIDWKGFCEANGVKIGESFTLEFISEQYKTTYVLKFCSNCGD